MVKQVYAEMAAWNDSNHGVEVDFHSSYQTLIHALIKTCNAERSPNTSYRPLDKHFLR